MRILACHISGFGCHSGLDRQFTPGLNNIIQENGTGKTTLREFMTVMLYSFADELTGRVGKEREKWRPWQGGAYGGTMDVSSGGRNYRIERTFGTRPKEDLLRVYDLSTRLPVQDLGEIPGKTLLDVDRETFHRTIAIGSDFSETRVDGRIHSKIGNLTDDLIDVNCFEDAEKRLKDCLNKWSEGSSKGELYQLNAEITGIGQEIALRPGIEENLEKVDEALRALRDEKVALQKEQEAIGEKERALAAYRDVADVFARRDSLRETLETRKAEEARLQATLPNGLPPEEKLEEMRALLHAAETKRDLGEAEALSDTEKAELEAGFAVFPDGPATKEEGDRLMTLAEEWQKSGTDIREREVALADHREERAEAYKENQRSGVIGVWIALGLFALGIVALFLYRFAANSLVFAIAGGALVLAGILGVILSNHYVKKLRDEAEKPDEAETEAEEVIRTAIEAAKNAESEIKAFLTRYGRNPRPETASTEIARVLRAGDRFLALKEKKARLDERAEEAEKGLREVRGFLSLYMNDPAEDIADALITLKDRADRFRNAEEERVRAERTLRNYEAEQREALASTLEKPDFPESLSDLSDRLQEIREKQEEIRRKEAEYGRDRDRFSDRLQALDEKEGTLFDKKERRIELREKVRLTNAAAKYLEQAKNDLSGRFRDPLTEAFREYASRITGVQENFSLNADGEAVFEENGRIRKVDLLSTGYRKLTYFALRLALTDRMYPDEKPMLFLDDPFQDLDTGKLDEARKIVREAAERYQIFYFTCHPSRSL